MMGMDSGGGIMDVRPDDLVGGVGLAESEPAPDSVPTPRRPSGLRLRLTTMLALVAALAPAIAFYVAMMESSPDPDQPIVALLAVVLSGLLVGMLRRASPVRITVQVALACAALRLAIEIDGTRLAKYELVSLLAVVVLALLIGRAPGSSGREGRRRARVGAGAAVLLDVALNVAAFWTFLLADATLGIYLLVQPPTVPVLPFPVPAPPVGVPVPPVGFSSDPFPAMPYIADDVPHLRPGGAGPAGTDLDSNNLDKLLAPTPPVPAPEAAPKAR